MVLDFTLGVGMKRKAGLYLSDLVSSDVSLDSMVTVRGTVHGPSTASEYHFNLFLDTWLPEIAVFCDNPTLYRSAEYVAVLQRMSSRFQSGINPTSREGTFAKPQDKQVLIAILEGVFDEFNVPKESRHLVVDYKTR